MSMTKAYYEEQTAREEDTLVSSQKKLADAVEKLLNMLDGAEDSFFGPTPRAVTESMERKLPQGTIAKMIEQNTKLRERVYVAQNIVEKIVSEVGAG
jgi:hypothetical protein